MDRQRRKAVDEWLTALILLDAFIGLWVSPRLPDPWGHVALATAGTGLLAACGVQTFALRGRGQTLRDVVIGEVHGIAESLRRMALIGLGAVTTLFAVWGLLLLAHLVIR